MSTYDMAFVPSPGTSIGRGVVRVSPRLYYVVQGTLKSDHTTSETWVSRGSVDLKPTTHESCRVLGQFYQE